MCITIGLIILILVIAGICGCINAEVSYDDHSDDWAARVQALMMIHDLKYKNPELWAKCASKIMGRSIEAPTKEDIKRYNKIKNA